ncbi:MAG: hypothetical protein M3291_11260 [Actinomycetota bacterium]|nr:hypothetical protein [Actinomycetota bacterium]
MVDLDRLRELPITEYLRGEVYAGRYLVQVSAQTCIDLANHIIASEGWRAPRDFGDTFTVNRPRRSRPMPVRARPHPAGGSPARQ